MLAQAAAIPFLHTPQGVRFCLITSLAKRRWSFPKGIIDPGETAPETALKETWEEAGLSGEVVGQPLGSYTYHKWDTDLEVTVYLLQVTAVGEDWPEAAVRQRRWATADEARQLLADSDWQSLFDTACQQLQPPCD